ncbi:SDR family oxidoreductase [Amycolatopsis tucumanensis]|uniref:SDR family oxidoreductase n=1 Tax=Amycolatopsis tucumanensis TaxID=401106 RepID=A0ABP7HCK8_9PSEU|nr:SDR family oxidoreductase [Amycolatopsis tucumanensis]MCF6421506.1 SDR family oxidoreductase [Amycolatopsis tucumanensis]
MSTETRKTVLITGSSSGFGKATAELFLDRGWNVVATARRPLPEGYLGPGTEHLLTCVLDVTDPDSIQAALRDTLTRFGRLDCVVNNAGAGLFSVFEATPMATVRALFETNVFGMMQVTQAALPMLADQGGGRLIAISSGAGIVPEPLLSVYSATKFAVEGFTESLRYEAAARGVSVKLVEPGLVRGTNFLARTAESAQAVPVPAGYEPLVRQVMGAFEQEGPYRLATAQTVAEAVVTAAEDDSTQLRYLVGEDVENSARMRRETSEKDYNDWALARVGGQ